jgi:hypothetical protein
VAVLHCGFPDWADCVPIAGNFFVRPGSEHEQEGPIPTTNEIGIGDITYVVGLFNKISGKKANLPVVHTGHVALLPRDEKIPVWDRVRGPWEVEGYLVQAHALDGLSGAPVFARISYPVYGDFRREPSTIVIYNKVAGRMHGLTVLLGLWQASWEGEPSSDVLGGRAAGRKVPIGFGIVVPAHRIAEALNREELVMSRQNEYEGRLMENPAVADAHAPSDESPAPATDANRNDDVKATSVASDDGSIRGLGVSSQLLKGR